MFGRRERSERGGRRRLQRDPGRGRRRRNRSLVERVARLFAAARRRSASVTSTTPSRPPAADGRRRRTRQRHAPRRSSASTRCATSSPPGSSPCCWSSQSMSTTILRQAMRAGVSDVLPAACKDPELADLVRSGIERVEHLGSAGDGERPRPRRRRVLAQGRRGHDDHRHQPRHRGVARRRRVARSSSTPTCPSATSPSCWASIRRNSLADATGADIDQAAAAQPARHEERQRPAHAARAGRPGAGRSHHGRRRHPHARAVPPDRAARRRRHLVGLRRSHAVDPRPGRRRRRRGRRPTSSA